MYSLSEIKRIHSKKLAIKNKQYIAADGFIYIGTEENRLKKLEQANSVVTENNYNTLSGDNVEDVLESIDNQISDVIQNGYKVFAYDVNGNLTNKKVYEDSTLSNLMYTFVYSYTGDDLTNINITREEDSFNYQKQLAYDINGNLTSIDLII